MHGTLQSLGYLCVTVIVRRYSITCTNIFSIYFQQGNCWHSTAQAQISTTVHWYYNIHVVVPWYLVHIEGIYVCTLVHVPGTTILHTHVLD
jgi:hypothetical protein